MGWRWVEKEICQVATTPPTLPRPTHHRYHTPPPTKPPLSYTTSIIHHHYQTPLSYTTTTTIKHHYHTPPLSNTTTTIKHHHLTMTIHPPTTGFEIEPPPPTHFDLFSLSLSLFVCPGRSMSALIRKRAALSLSTSWVLHK